jgi:signal peptidase II
VQLFSIIKANKKPLIISVFLGTLDNFIKYLIRSNDINDLIIMEGILEIDLNYNTGIAFGFLKDQAPFTFILSLAVLVWLIFQFKNQFKNRIEEYAFILVLGGAFGNLGERFINLINGNDGKVTDFIELLFIPSFNLADSFISIGIFLLILSELIDNSD